MNKTSRNSNSTYLTGKQLHAQHNTSISNTNHTNNFINTEGTTQHTFPNGKL